MDDSDCLTILAIYSQSESQEHECRKLIRILKGLTYFLLVKECIVGNIALMHAIFLRHVGLSVLQIFLAIQRCVLCADM